ncbi:hypothetical protein [Aquamicrobium zhengzhouense]|uniref:Uncharacterized protein n=1 Tax=Aquamicrobium zhengzhouense TaxID=2781738 RepID=A0ABS0SCI3_9HYPH|nr:hypothetical protein [Aquamicrobium zhengzhouense]MBI1620350.1 hypothetical protein [Aquamicrobium zhengzhouense]
MINMPVTHKPSGTAGKVDGVSVTADGKPIVRVADRWFFADEIEAAAKP